MGGSRGLRKQTEIAHFPKIQFRPNTTTARRNAEKRYNSLEIKMWRKLCSSYNEQVTEAKDDTIIGRSVVMRIGAKRANVQRDLNKVQEQRNAVQERIERYNQNDEAYYKEKGLYWE